MKHGVVTDIQRFSIHDGPGIRTTVFLKGCNLHCFWCHNPETLDPRPQLQVFLDRCIGCGECFKRCPSGAQVIVDGQREYRRELCVGCGWCAETCYSGALELIGETKTVEEVMDVVLQDLPFYRTSGGGVTLSGGEPLLQHDFSFAILRRCKEEGIHTGVETAASFPWRQIESILAVTDLVMLDIKLMDPGRHRECTGVTNAQILANAVRLGQRARDLIVRTPIIPGVNDSVEDVVAIAEFIAGLPNLRYYELLPFHAMAADKYESLGRGYRAIDLVAPSRERMRLLADAARHCGIDVRHR